MTLNAATHPSTNNKSARRPRGPLAKVPPAKLLQNRLVALLAEARQIQILLDTARKIEAVTPDTVDIDEPIPADADALAGAVIGD